METNLKKRIEEDVKTAMRAGDKPRLGTLRMVLAAVKQQEVDTRSTLDDPALIAILEKLIKQRRDSLTQFQAAGRHELADKEAYEITVIQEYLPPALDEDE
ncbi:MAG TPA: GatB/YqeY domain-containing protein, partial [Gammaproteobacteria bacterium]|nr:GatB/YqeY domain-containing protein [Gammaproteobacteria bacterium]